MTDSVEVLVPMSEAMGLILGSVVTLEIRGRITRLGETYPGDGDGVRVAVEGEVSLTPGSIRDIGLGEMKRLSNARGLSDFPIGMSELHAP